MSRIIHQTTIGRRVTVNAQDLFEPLDNIEITYYVGGTYNAGTDSGTLATIFQANTGASQGPSPSAGATGGPNPYITGESGMAETYLEPSDTGYDIKIKDLNVSGRIATRVIYGWGFADPADLTADLIDALAGTSGAPSAANKYITNADSRNSNSRAPSGAAGGDLSGTYPNPSLSATIMDLLIPPGSMLATGRATAPAGWLLCQGQVISRAGVNADLFNAIGTAYGSGDGSTTFQLPDLRGRVPVGEDGTAGRMPSNDARGNAAGEATHTMNAFEMPTHTHNVQPAGAHIHNANGSYFMVPAYGPGGGIDTGLAFGFRYDAGNYQTLYQQSTNSAGSHDHVVDPQGGSQPHNNMQPYQVVNWMIKL